MNTNQQRHALNAQMLAHLGVLAVLGIAVGLFGLTAYAVARYEPPVDTRCDAVVDRLDYYAGPQWRDAQRTPTGQWCILVN